jgi:hypothetical protein
VSLVNTQDSTLGGTIGRQRALALVTWAQRKGGSRAGPSELGYGGVQTVYREEGQTILFLSEFFNMINHPQFANPGLKGAVEKLLASVSPRVIQLGTEVFVRGGIHDELQVPQ